MLLGEVEQSEVVLAWLHAYVAHWWGQKKSRPGACLLH